MIMDLTPTTHTLVLLSSLFIQDNSNYSIFLERQLSSLSRSVKSALLRLISVKMRAVTV